LYNYYAAVLPHEQSQLLFLFEQLVFPHFLFEQEQLSVQLDLLASGGPTGPPSPEKTANPPFNCPLAF